MHENGYCHRDLKPENCMIERGSNLLKVCLESRVYQGASAPIFLSLHRAQNPLSTGHHDMLKSGPKSQAPLVYLNYMGAAGATTLPIRRPLLTVFRRADVKAGILLFWILYL